MVKNDDTLVGYTCERGHMYAGRYGGVYGDDKSGFVTKWTNGVKVWGKFFFGNNDSSLDNIKSMLFVQVSRSA